MRSSSSSLTFAVSPFLANYILRDVDEAISKLNVLYYRYSDDILILGPDFEQARDILYRKLAEKGLTINPNRKSYHRLP